jgi:MATE family multidrug resistance protein
MDGHRTDERSGDCQISAQNDTMELEVSAAEVIQDSDEREHDHDHLNQKGKETIVEESQETIHRDEFSFAQEVPLLFQISLPTVAVQFCTFFIFPLTASAIGQNLKPQNLGAFTLATLTGNMTCVSIIIGTLTASETLQPRAFGLKQYREVGVLAVRGLIVCLIFLAIPVACLSTLVEETLMYFGQQHIISSLAAEWVHVFLWSLPSLLFFRLIQRFLACQNEVTPCVFGAAIGVLLHPFLLKPFIEHFGFQGSALSIVVTQTVQTSLAVLYMVVIDGSYVKKTWPGLDWDFVKEAFNPSELLKYFKLSIGGVVSLSEWWFWESICFIAGKFGLTSLCAHSIAYQILPLVFMIPLGISIGLSVRMGQLLPQDVHKTKLLAFYTMLFTCAISILVSAIMYRYQSWIFAFFTRDADVLDECRKIWGSLCIYVPFLYIFCINSGIMRGLGLQWRMAAAIVAVLWCIFLPLIIF